MYTSSVPYMDPEGALLAFAFTAILYVILTLVVVLLVRPVASRLLVLGLLTAVAGIMFTALIPSVALPALVLVILAAILVVAGLLAALISYLIQASTTANPPT